MQKQVADYLRDHVNSQDKDNFLQLIREWDGSYNVLDSFYDLDLLHQLNRASKEMR